MKKIFITESQLKAFLGLNEETERNEYECLNEASSSMGGMRMNAVASKLTFQLPTRENVLVSEGIDWDVPRKKWGGIIVFSTDVNAVKMSDNKFINFVKQKFTTIVNRFKATEKVDKIANKYSLVGWTIGHYFDGRYKSKSGKNFGENSLTIEVVGVDNNTMIKITEDVCREFQQECVLLRLFNGRVLFINPK